MRTQSAIVAIVQDDEHRFLVTYNAKWQGYAFPMISLPDDGEILGSLAIQAVENDSGCRLPKANTSELDYMGHFGISQRTGEETYYQYWLYEVEPNQRLEMPATSEREAHPPLFLSYEELTSRTDLTWSTTALVREFVEQQEAVLAVITRAGETESEFLLVWNNNYSGYVFPTQRVKTEVKPEPLALRLLQADLGYRGPATATWHEAIPDIHFSGRYQRDRRYQFHLCEMHLPEVDLHQPQNLLEKSLLARRKRFLWLPASRLNDANIQFSPTMRALSKTVVLRLPPQTFGERLRTSEGGIALIQCTHEGRRQWLAQWNENWHCFFFIGGHREEGETFRECVIREIAEELGLQSSECPVAATAAHHLEYRALSRSAGQLTNYVMELFDAQPTNSALIKIAANSHNKWLDEHEIERLQTHDGRKVSGSMGVMLSLAGLMHNP